MEPHDGEQQYVWQVKDATPHAEWQSLQPMYYAPIERCISRYVAAKKAILQRINARVQEGKGATRMQDVALAKVEADSTVNLVFNADRRVEVPRPEQRSIKYLKQHCLAVQLDMAKRTLALLGSEPKLLRCMRVEKKLAAVPPEDESFGLRNLLSAYVEGEDEEASQGGDSDSHDEEHEGGALRDPRSSADRAPDDDREHDEEADEDEADDVDDAAVPPSIKLLFESSKMGSEVPSDAIVLTGGEDGKGGATLWVTPKAPGGKESHTRTSDGIAAPCVTPFVDPAQLPPVLGVRLQRRRLEDHEEGLGGHVHAHVPAHPYSHAHT